MTTPLPVQDLRDRLELGLERGRGLLSAEELDRAEVLLGVEGEAALVLARLSARKPPAFRLLDLTVAGVEDLVEVVEEMLGVGLLVRERRAEVQLELATRKVLAASCRRHGLPVSGRRAELVSRLRSLEVDTARWVRIADATLILRLERWAVLQVSPDRSAAVLERMGAVRWPVYQLTEGRGLMSTRGAWLAWEDLVERWEELTTEEALAALAWQWPPGGLDLSRSLRRRLMDVARQHEREGEVEQAERIYRAMLDRVEPLGEVPVRLARTLEAAGRPVEAYQELRDLHERAVGPERLAIVRAGRRLSRAVRRAWPPDPPAPSVVERLVPLELVGGDEARPLWMGGHGPVCIEQAVSDALEAAGRTVLRGEAPVFRTLFALLFARVMFLPVPGQLPVPRLAGPMDAGRPAFAARRAMAVWEVLDGLAAGEGPDRVAAGWDEWNGIRLHGARWDVGRQQLVELAAALGARGLRAVVWPQLARGRRAARGLPDLVVLPGERVQLEGAHPSTVPEGLMLVEVKGPTDSLRDAQRVWIARLMEAGVPVEVWAVRPTR